MLEIIHIKQSHRRSYAIQFNNDGNLVVKTNKLFPQFMITQLLEKHKPWIDKHRHDFEERNNGLIKKGFVNGDTFNILGVDYTLSVQESRLKNTKVELKDNLIVVKLPNDSEQIEAKSLDSSRLSRPSMTRNNVEVAIEKQLRKAAKEIFVFRVVHFAKLYGFEFNNVAIKEQKSKWGSCSSNGNLNFNWKLIFASQEVLDYVVVHEVCHLKEMNHSSTFWDLVTLQCPDYKIKKKWLRESGRSLHMLFNYSKVV